MLLLYDARSIDADARKLLGGMSTNLEQDHTAVEVDAIYSWALR